MAHFGAAPSSVNEHIQCMRGAARKALFRKVLCAARRVRADLDGFEMVRIARAPHLNCVEAEHRNPRCKVAVRVRFSLLISFE